MKSYTYKIFVQESNLHPNLWEGFFETIAEYDKHFVFEVSFIGQDIEFHLESTKDLSTLSAKIRPFVLQPEVQYKIQHIATHKKYSFNLSQTSNIVEIKEHREVKDGYKLEKVLWKSYTFFSFHLYTVSFLFSDQNGNKKVSRKLFSTLPLFLLQIDFSKSLKYSKKSLPSYLQIEEVSHLFQTDQSQGFLEVDGFPYFINTMHFPLKNFEFDKHTLIVGQTGVGKSKFIEGFIKEIKKRGLENEYAVILIDPHASLFSNFSSSYMHNIDFQNTACELFPSNSEPKIATELTILLFKTLLKDQFNAKMERVLKYTLFTLFLTNTMSLLSMKKFLTELEYRKEVVEALGEYDNLVHFFDTEFIEMQTKFYEIAIMPILVLIDELSFLTIFNLEQPSSLVQSIEENFLTCFSLNKIFLGEKATKLIAGLLIQEIFLLSQQHAFSKKVILIIDEVSTVENDALVAILAEARKFNLSLVLTEQYLAQTQSDLLKAILSNVYNYFIFKIAQSDAKILGQNIQIDFADEVAKLRKEKGEDEEAMKTKLMTTLNPRECLVRIFSQAKFQQTFKAKTMEVL